MSQSEPPTQPYAPAEHGHRASVDGESVTPSPSLGHLAVPSVFESEAGSERYQIQHVLGEGGNGRVYSVFDRDLEREVAFKVVPEDNVSRREVFLREARVTAGLSHPNVPPLYDVGASDGVVYLSMQRVPGRSLGALIRDAVADGAAEVMPASRLVEVMLKVCDAVSFAHARGVVHCDIKPDNVMVGAYGEVMLVDWGAARSGCDNEELSSRFVGTPAYLAPEQVTGAPPTPASDVYALGVTLFYTLLMRKPMRTSADDFWERKLRGKLDPPTAEELGRVPRPLLSVALKAMSVDPGDRYPDVAALGEALRDFQAGRTAWAAPLARESLGDDGYLERWVAVPEGAFERDQDRLVSRAPKGALLVYKQRFSPGVALEFDGEILPGARPGDLSVLWTDDDLFSPQPHWPKEGTALSLQIAAFDNLHVGIYRDFERCLAGRSLSIEVGRRYRIRAEIDEHSLKLFLDGELVAEFEELFPLASGYVAIYSYAPGKAFSNIRLFERGVPERLQPTAVGDAFYARGDYEPAAEHYARLEQLLPRSELCEEARFKRGLCMMRGGDAGSANEIWAELESELWQARAALHAIDVAFNAGRHREVVDELRRLLSDVPLVKAHAINRWEEYVMSLCGSDMAPLGIYADLRDALFPDHPASAATAAQLENARGNWQLVLEHYSDQHVEFVQACNELGEFQRVCDRYPNIDWIRDMALLCLNQHEHPALASSPFVPGLRGDVELALERGDCTEAQLATGRFEDVLRDRHSATGDQAAALRGLDRCQEAAERGDGRALCVLDAGEAVLSNPLVLEERLYVLHHLSLSAFMRGDLEAYRRHHEAAEQLPCSALWGEVWLHRFFLFPLVERELGDEDALECALSRVLAEHPRHWFEKGRYLARFVRAEIPLAEFEAQPLGLLMRGRSIVARALRAERERNQSAAEAAYTEYLGLPSLERTPDSPRGDPLFERWARYRLRRGTT